MTHPQTTDRDRLAEAFRQLRRRGIRARANFQCCVTCAIHAFRDGARYVYWTRQDEKRAFDGRGNVTARGLYLGWGNVNPREVVDVLRAAGLLATWDSDEYHRILQPARQAA